MRLLVSMSSLAVSALPFAPRVARSWTRFYVEDPVCRCGHGLSVHADSTAATARGCEACRSILELKLRTPSGESCSSYGR